MRVEPRSSAASSIVEPSEPATSRPAFGVAVQRARAELPQGAPALDRFVRELDQSTREMSRTMQRMRANATLSNEQLLAAQLTFYRHAQLVEVAAKGVEKVSSGLRQLAQNQ